MVFDGAFSKGFYRVLDKVLYKKVVYSLYLGRYVKKVCCSIGFV